MKGLASYLGPSINALISYIRYCVWSEFSADPCVLCVCVPIVLVVRRCNDDEENNLASYSMFIPSHPDVFGP